MLLADKVEPLENIRGAAARVRCERLAESSSPRQMAEVMESFLQPNELNDPAERGLQRLSVMEIPLDRVVSDAGLSERHFRRVCVERVGASPKYLRRILRFRGAVERIRKLSIGSAQPSWAQFAVTCGYYDQAHMIREFREFGSLTPVRYLQYAARQSALESTYDESIRT